MDASTIDRWIDALADPHFLRWVLWGGFAVVTLSLLVLMQTRWGQARPLRKCVILSLVAHLLLACYSTTVHINAQTAALSRPRTAVMRVTEVRGLPDGDTESDETPDDENAAAARPWEAFSTDRTTAPEGIDLERPATVDVAAPTRRAASAAAPWETQPALPDAGPGELQLPQPDNVPVDDVAGGPETARSPEPIEAPQASRRETDETVVDDAPGPQPAASASGAGALPVRRTTSDEVPQELLDPPGLPPELNDAPTVTAPASALVGEEDDLRRYSGGPADLNATTAGSSGSSGLPDGGSPGGTGTARGNDGGEVDGIVRRSTGGGQSPDELLNPQPLVGPARATLRRERGGEHGVPDIYTARTAPDRGAIAETRGGTGETEGSVQAALGWLAASQSEDGRWDASRHGAGQQSRTEGQNAERARALAGTGAQADTGVTGLALLAFLGAGHTHLDGPYAETVRRGLEFLIASQRRDGTEFDGSLQGSADKYAAMYCHGMATCALSEAYGMTADPLLEEPLRKAVAYTLSAQHPTSGGWRYEPGKAMGDTSQLGWQLMALKSAELAGFDIPQHSRDGMRSFLASVAVGRNRGLAKYQPLEQYQHNRTMTAEALVCRQFLGIADAASSAEAAEFILRELPGEGTDNYYYWYYATLATFHLQGDAWRTWNQALRDTLVGSQRGDGPESGSWDPDPVWGSYGGRVYSTALAALSLEVYYRYLPLYAGHVK